MKKLTKTDGRSGFGPGISAHCLLKEYAFSNVHTHTHAHAHVTCTIAIALLIHHLIHSRRLKVNIIIMINYKDTVGSILLAEI